MKLAAALTLLAIASFAPAEDTFFDSKGVKIRYVTAGQGEPVILIHGWMSDSSFWGNDGKGNTKLTPAPGFRAIAIDIRGHGKSGKPHKADAYGAEMANDVIRLMDHLKIKKAHLVGYSMGAFIVGKVAATHPDRVKTAFYGGQAPLITGQDNRSSEIDIFAKAVEDGKGLGPYLVHVAPAPKPNLQQANAYASMLYAGKDTKAWALAGKSFPALAVGMKELARCKAPTLFLHGDKEAPSTQKRVTLWRKTIKSELIIVKGTDHMTTLTKPEFASGLIGFLNKNRG